MFQLCGCVVTIGRQVAAQWQLRSPRRMMVMQLTWVPAARRPIPSDLDADRQWPDRNGFAFVRWFVVIAHLPTATAFGVITRALTSPCPRAGRGTLRPHAPRRSVPQRARFAGR